MKRGDLVQYIERPDWGKGFIDRVTETALIEATFEINGRLFTDQFSPHELAVIEPAKATA